MKPFAERVLRWFDQHGRHDLPWQHPRSPYRVWLSEVMLQQTQVTTVIPYFARFLDRFPDVASLAAAPLDDVLALWAGLGYYARARNLHRCAQVVVAEHDGEFPRDFDAIAALPGIGRSTAGAILAQAHGQRLAILDGNVRRVLARHAAIDGWPGQPAVQKQLWQEAERHLPHERLADYTQAMMDLGASVCTARAPKCPHCPIRDDCRARLDDTIARYPGAKPKRERPQRSAQLLLIHDADGCILLERRPPAGLWGALWCPPLLDDGDAPLGDWLAAQSLRQLDAQVLAPFTHSFTHFDLELRPTQLRVEAAADAIGESRWQWIAADRLATLGLPAPIRKMLDSLPASTRA